MQVSEIQTLTTHIALDCLYTVRRIDFVTGCEWVFHLTPYYNNKKIVS
jgi:hypothetical protein